MLARIVLFAAAIVVAAALFAALARQGEAPMNWPWTVRTFR